MDALGFLAKLIGTTARIGGAVALAALVLFIFRRSGVEPFTTLDPAVYGITIVAGIIGGCVVVVEFFVVFGKWSGAKIQAHLKTSADAKIKRDTALKNMQSISEEYIVVLLFLKGNNWKRFPAPTRNLLLFYMMKAFLLERDDPSYVVNSVTTYYMVPDYVWERIDALAGGSCDSSRAALDRETFAARMDALMGLGRSIMRRVHAGSYERLTGDVGQNGTKSAPASAVTLRRARRT
jgi:hypothetical protein